jgi:multidrug transporter EmrE-like cation transporter
MKFLSRSGIFITAMIISEIISQYFLQKAVIVKKEWYKNWYLYAGLIGQLLMAGLYFLVLKSGYSLAIANTLIDGGGALGIVLLGYYIFNQKLSHKQLLAVIITIIGVVLLGIFDK